MPLDNAVRIQTRRPSFVFNVRRNTAVRSALSTLWEAAAGGCAKDVAQACLENSRQRKSGADKGSPWSWPDVNTKSPGLGFTPLHACMAGLAAVSKGLDVSLPCTPARPSGRNVSCVASKSRYSRLARQRNSSDCSAKRSSSEYVAACRVLLASGANADALDARCRTPLCLAAASGSVEATEILLNGGADPCAVDADGNSPAHFAFAYANAAVAATLAKEGADLDTLNEEGKSPQDVAGLSALLSGAGANRAAAVPRP